MTGSGRGSITFLEEYCSWQIDQNPVIQALYTRVYGSHKLDPVSFKNESSRFCGWAVGMDLGGVRGTVSEMDQNMLYTFSKNYIY